jgi:hypothetical protein
MLKAFTPVVVVMVGYLTGVEQTNIKVSTPTASEADSVYVRRRQLKVIHPCTSTECQYPP